MLRLKYFILTILTIFRLTLIFLPGKQQIFAPQKKKKGKQSNE